MKHEERAIMLEEWTEKLSELVDRDIWDGLTEKFAPVKYRNGKLLSPDKYARAVESIYWDLEDILDRLTLLSKEATEESNQTINAYDMFYAWELGLCPSAVRAHPELRRYAGYVLEEIASKRNEDSLSYEDTEHAIQEWLSQNRRDRNGKNVA